jgi:opacity protein-like surface antigen
MTRKDRMRVLVMVVTIAAALSGIAHAQAPPAAPPTVEDNGYVEAFAQSAFGNVTSQAYGGEVGYTVRKNLQVFVEFGQVKNAAPPELGAAATLIAGFLRLQTPSNVAVSYSVKEPVTFMAGGVKYMIPITASRLAPYVMGGLGFAKVTKDVTFTVGDSDVTSQLTTLGVQLGSDLSGEFTKPMVTLGGGVDWPFWRQIVVGLQFRFSHIGAEDDTSSALNIGRAGASVGIRF